MRRLPAGPDLAKNYHFGIILNVLGNFWEFSQVSGKFWTLFGKFLMQLGNFSLLRMAKYWKIIHTSGHTGRFGQTKVEQQKIGQVTWSDTSWADKDTKTI